MADSLERFTAAREREIAARAALVACPRGRPLRRSRLLLRYAEALLVLALARTTARLETEQLIRAERRRRIERGED